MLRMLYCHNCGAPLSQEASFCPNCGLKLAAPQPQTQPVPPTPYSLPPPVPQQEKTHTHEAYKIAIGALLLLIVTMGIGWYATGSFSLLRSSIIPSSYRYQLASPPDYQSIQPPNTPTPSDRTVTWNSCGNTLSSGCNVTGNSWLEGTVPDTYDYFVSFTSTVPLKLYYFTMGQFVQFSVCSGAVSCVSGYYDSLPATASLQNSVFKLAEGCADYVSVLVASGNGVMHPNVSVARNPAPYATGYCAQVG